MRRAATVYLFSEDVDRSGGWAPAIVWTWGLVFENAQGRADTHRDTKSRPSRRAAMVSAKRYAKALGCAVTAFVDAPLVQARTGAQA